jgi:hypothetical protein
MADYQIDYRWDVSQTIPVLWLVVTGRLLTDHSAISSMIDQAHALAERHDEYNAVHLAYDLRATEGTLPLSMLMRRTRTSGKIKRVAIIGARSRLDEMAILISASAKQLPYEFGFFTSQEHAVDFLYARDDQSALS